MDSRAHVHQNKASMNDIKAGVLQGKGLPKVHLEVADICWQWPATPFSTDRKTGNDNVPAFRKLLNIGCDDLCVRKLESCLNGPEVNSSENEATNGRNGHDYHAPDPALFKFQFQT